MTSLSPYPDSGQHTMGIDIGGTKTQAVVLDRNGGVVASASLPTRQGAESVIETTHTVYDMVSKSTGPVTSIGVGVPGVVDASGRVQHAVNVGLVDVDLARALTYRLGTKTVVSNDVSMAALGAAHHRDDAKSLALLNLGTGLAVGLVIGGELYKGETSVAGEIGHLPVDETGPRCKCGQRGCLELYVSGSAIARMWPTTHGHPAADLFCKASAGEPAALEIQERFISRLAWTVQQIVVAFDVAEVVIAGGLSSLGRGLTEPLLDCLRIKARESPFVESLELERRVQLLPADYPAAAIGAALHGAGLAGGMTRDAIPSSA
ncbi:ROK family protein [Paenarthrobacter sp. AB444]|uniref:ROK family protein n=1 Tax=Paenarthrobacter sp. AB444 TaxID=3025681 RepID=UPI0023673F29|nr:ROK family protein [Paenarthrobacter sp. AB444]MDD7833904.1 ROK family protein [Paenarthrobacter sp. AB444]